MSGRSYPVLRDGFSSFAKAIDRIRNRPVSRSMTVSVIPSFAAKWLLPRLPRFQSANPDIHLRLHTSPEAVDLAGGVADVAIRYGVGPYPGLVAHKMFREQFVPLCSPALGLQKPEDLRNATLLHFDWLRPDDATPTWQRWGQVAEGLIACQTRASVFPMTVTPFRRPLQAKVSFWAVR